MKKLSSYTFLPWLRSGVANNIQQADGDAAIQQRATVNVAFDLVGEQVDSDATTTENISKDVQLYGPGDIVGIDKKSIVKNEPRDWITDFETNYLPYVEFYDEDFPWRYTPAAPDMGNHRLRPWITLVVLKEDEFEDGKNILNRPLPYIEVADSGVSFPSPDTLWAWAHVHVNQQVTPNGSNNGITSTDTDHIITELEKVLNKNPDLAYSRVVCPRKLSANTAYHAFLIPTFETGRLAGLGHSTAESPHATFSGWGNTYPSQQEASLFPYYHRWYFRTAEEGDFEYLVRLLKPRMIDSRVGRRDMDVLDPGANLPGIDDEALEGILRLGGALKVPEEALNDAEKEKAELYENWDGPDGSDPHPFQEKLAALLNLPTDYDEQAAAVANAASGLGENVENDEDPLIAPPIYGRWHAIVNRVLRDGDGDLVSNTDNWVHELNLDPRHRVAAGFGTQIVQENQETYMDAAWEQVGRIIEANRRIRLAQLAKQASYSWHYRHIAQPVAQAESLFLENTFKLLAPMQSRVMDNNLTARYRMIESVVPTAITSAPLRRIARPRGRLVKQLPFTEAITPGNLIRRISDGSVQVVKPKTIPDTLPTPDQVAEDTQPGGETTGGGIIGQLEEKYPWLKWVLLFLLLILFLMLALLTLSGTAQSIIGAIAAITAVLFYRLFIWNKQEDASDSIKEENLTPEAVDDLPNSPDFRITFFEDTFRPSRGNTDSAEAVRFKTALKDSFTLIEASNQVDRPEPTTPLNVTALTATMVAQVNPLVTIPNFVYTGITIPLHIIAIIGERFVEAMAYPEFDIPMYRPLVDTSSELFLPNIQLIAQNSISILETNQPFIEAYMVGLNHEFARELLWREYPTDQRGSYFRQFWDVSSYLNRGGEDPEELKEKLRDIPPLHRWSKFSQLGDHDHREMNGDKEDELVLVIRGDLLKKYPNAVIYAHRARWQLTDGEIDNTKERRLVDVPDDDLVYAPTDPIILTPLYEAKVNPDIYFFGFDLTVDEARGQRGDDPDDDPGWFFVIKERPGEPRFGLDVSSEPGNKQVWNDIAWTDLQPEVIDGGFIAPGQNFTLEEPVGTEDSEKHPQWEDDRHISWNNNMNAADLAYLLYQVPVMVAIHASEMLRTSED